MYGRGTSIFNSIVSICSSASFSPEKNLFCPKKSFSNIYISKHARVYRDGPTDVPRGGPERLKISNIVKLSEKGLGIPPNTQAKLSHKPPSPEIILDQRAWITKLQEI